MVLHIGDLHYENIAQNDSKPFLDAYQSFLGLEKRQKLLRNVPMDYVWNDHDFGAPPHTLANAHDATGCLFVWVAWTEAGLFCTVRIVGTPAKT